MKSKAWLSISSAAKHQLSQHQQSLLYQQSLPTITTIRPYLSSPAASTPLNDTPTTTTHPHAVDLNSNANQNPLNREQIRNMAVATAAHYYPIYNQPSSRYKQKRFLSSSSISCHQSNALAFHDEHPHDPQNHKSLPLLNFFSKSYAKPVPSYIFAHGASGFAKRQRYTTPDSNRNRNEHYYSIQIGEDAYFRRSDAIGVADGVGGWQGVSAANAALYSRKLMHHAYLELERFDNVDDPCFYHYDEADPVSILQKSYEESMQEAQQEGIIGSCTACLAILRHEELRIANLGDCGISVIRHNDYIFRSEEQQHSFNFPYQLGTSSPDRPKDAQSFTVAVEKGDIIIMGSDGLFDNLFDREILSIVKSQLSAFTLPGSGNRPPRMLSIEPQKISDALAERAKAVSNSKLNVDSPFQVRAVNEGLYYQGGKADDISVIVAIVKDCEDSPDRRL
ncbi:uncharacterized protein ATC70_012358 [Mucor velutinosus]|uniref:Protein phosphatase n=1 Tax=Mucor velutinosus TaxID=708070 RepID=A0AAN7HXF8_9FUNG|nr:hypothetical protein ATC70_012358 [Mucor velutinosus]